MFGEEYTLVACADYVLGRLGGGNTVSNLSSSRALRDVTQQHGGKYTASAVGEVNVVLKMKETQYGNWWRRKWWHHLSSFALWTRFVGGSRLVFIASGASKSIV